MDEAELEEAMNLLISQKELMRPAYGVDNLKDKVAAGELTASVPTFNRTRRVYKISKWFECIDLSQNDKYNMV